MEKIKTELSRVREIDTLADFGRLEYLPDRMDTIRGLGALVVIEEQMLAAYNSLDAIRPEFPEETKSAALRDQSAAWQAAALGVESAMTAVANLRSEIVRTEFSLSVSSEADRAQDEIDVQARLVKQRAEAAA